MGKRILKVIFRVFLVLTIIVTAYFGYNFIQYQRIKDDRPIETLVDDIRNNPDFLTVDEISEKFLDALVATEDRRFYDRKGFDFRALARSIVTNIKEGEFVQGGSTIPQQVGKLLYFDHDQDLNEKVIQVYIMYDLESLYSKDEILELYVNSIYFGSGYTGIKQASEGYFDSSALDLSWAESTLLAGIIPAPSVYDPTINFDLAKDRQYAVLLSLQNTGVINEDQAERIYNTPLVIY